MISFQSETKMAAIFPILSSISNKIKWTSEPNTHLRLFIAVYLYHFILSHIGKYLKLSFTMFLLSL